jgi:hypothetical protein
LAAWLGVVALLAQTCATLLAMPQFIAGAPSDGLHAGVMLPDCPGENSGAPKGMPHSHKQCAICVALQISSTFVAAPPWTTAHDLPASASIVAAGEIRLAGSASFDRPHTRAPPVPSSV